MYNKPDLKPCIYCDDKHRHNNCPTTRKNELVQTAVVTASGPTTRRQARILVDTGSQKTFITQDLRKKLQVKPIQNGTLDIATFGTTKSTTKTYEVVTFILNAVNEDIRIMALFTPIICTPLSNNVQLTEIPPEFKTLNIADSVEEKNDHNIDIVIENDHYAQVIVETRRNQKTNDG